LSRRKTREGTWIKINWNKFRRIIFKDPSNTFTEISKKHKIKKQEEMEMAEASEDVDNIYDIWMESKANVSKPKKLTDDVRMLIAKAIDRYGTNTIKEAVKNLEYATTDSKIRSWYTHKWSLKKFLEQSNALPNWIGDEWEALAMNPKNAPDNKEEKQLQAEETDFIHEEEVMDDMLDTFDVALDYVEEHNNKNINMTTFESMITFFNDFDESCQKVFSDIDNEVASFNIERFGSQAERDASKAQYHCLKPSSLFNKYLKYLELKVLTNNRLKRKIPINAADFDWSKHYEGFYEYYSKSGIDVNGMEHIKFHLKKLVNKKMNKRSDE
jgi:hypothetical protein